MGNKVMESEDLDEKNTFKLDINCDNTDLLQSSQKRTKNDLGDTVRDSKTRLCPCRICKKRPFDYPVHDCKICGKAFIRKRQLDTHIEETHRTKECVMCNRVFKSSAFRKHRKVCKIYSCNICNFETRLIYELKKHKKQHKEEMGIKQNNMKIFNCQICSYSTNRKFNLQLHTNRQHLHLPRPYFECNVCGKMLSAKYDLKRHKERKHSPKLESEKERKIAKPRKRIYHKCGYCDYKSDKRSRLEVHIVRIHTNPKPKKPQNPIQNRTCQNCNLVFTKVWNFKRHEINCQGARIFIGF